jgi:signal peptidase I
MPGRRPSASDRRVTIAAALILTGILSGGCATSHSVAPQSSLSRTKAIAMAKDTADALGGRVFTVSQTGSMKPTLDENSVVALEPAQYHELQAGDIVVYRNRNGRAVVHRLLQPSKSGWWVLGDNNAKADREAVTEDNLIGRVCAIFSSSASRPEPATTTIARR